MNKENKFSEDEIRKAWGTGKPVIYKEKAYRVCLMSYGDYFLEPPTWRGGEKDGFSKDTLWLEKVKDNPHYYEVAEQ